MMKGQRRPGNGFDLSEAPSHLIRRCQQFYGDLYAREAGGKELTKQQFILLCALEQNDGASQTALVEITGIDRSTLAEMFCRSDDVLPQRSACGVGCAALRILRKLGLAISIG